MSSETFDKYPYDEFGKYIGDAKHANLFRKKPVVIEARQFKTVEDADELVAWMRSYPTRGSQPIARYRDDTIVIPTLEGDMRAEIGDWIIKGVQDEFYPCKPDIFEATYESLI